MVVLLLILIVVVLMGLSQEWFRETTFVACHGVLTEGVCFLLWSDRVFILFHLMWLMRLFLAPATIRAFSIVKLVRYDK